MRQSISIDDELARRVESFRVRTDRPSTANALVVLVKQALDADDAALRALGLADNASAAK